MNNYGIFDARPKVREVAVRLGDLGKEFDWSRSPIPPLILNTTPLGPLPAVPGGHCTRPGSTVLETGRSARYHPRP